MQALWLHMHKKCTELAPCRHKLRAFFMLQARLGCNSELILDEFGEKLLEELDYQQEARNIEVRPSTANLVTVDNYIRLIRLQPATSMLFRTVQCAACSFGPSCSRENCTAPATAVPNPRYHPDLAPSSIRVFTLLMFNTAGRFIQDAPWDMQYTCSMCRTLEGTTRGTRR